MSAKGMRHARRMRDGKRDDETAAALIYTDEKKIRKAVWLRIFFSAFIFYRKIYLQTNNTASTYISGVIFFAFLQKRLITT